MVVNYKGIDYAINSKEDVTLNARIEEKDQLTYLHVEVDAGDTEFYPEVEVVFEHPFIEVVSCWQPLANRNKYLPQDWEPARQSYVVISSPIACFMNGINENKITCAYSDALNTVDFKMGLSEEKKVIVLRTILFSAPTKNLGVYKGVFRIDTRNIPYYKSISDVADWWAKDCGYTPMNVPASAKEPLYSTWYSYHQNMFADEITAQCKKAQAIGCKAIILDDGWQTKDNTRGYKFCGDWKVAENRFPDFAQHIKDVHALEMKYLIWYSVPYVGEISNAWNIFKDKMLHIDTKRQIGVLDPRYKEVRDYLIQVYEKAVVEWDLDGLKLDFVDRFKAFEGKPLDPKEGHDIKSLPEAVNVLLLDVANKLQAIKPDILIEFRQRYIGPMMRMYGNMFRVTDCPGDIINNRVGIADLRLTSGNTAVHSDMITWSDKENVESSALQLINILFGVPQISVLMEEITEQQTNMLKFWLEFWETHKETLMEGDFKPLYPELLYPVIIAESASEQIIAFYHKTVFTLDNANVKEIYLINGAYIDSVIFESAIDYGSCSVEKYNCLGELLETVQCTISKGLHKMDIAVSGYNKIILG